MKAVPDDQIRIGIVNTTLQWATNFYEVSPVHVRAVQPISNTKVRELVRKEQDKDEKLKALIDFKLTGVLPEDPVLAQSIQTQKDEFMVLDGVLHRDNPRNESQGLRPLIWI